MSPYAGMAFAITGAYQRKGSDMNWLISAGALGKHKAKPATECGAPSTLRVSAHRNGQWHLFPACPELTHRPQARKMWQDVLAALVDQ